MFDIMSGGVCIAENIDPGELTQKYRISESEVSGIISGLADMDEIEIPGIGTAIFSAAWLRQLAIDTLIEDAESDLTCREIAAATGRTVNGVTQILDRAKRKMLDAGVLRDFLRASLELKRLRRGDRADDQEIEITLETRVTVEY